MAEPFDAFVADLDTETEPVRVAALPSRARLLVDELGRALTQRGGEACNRSRPGARRIRPSPCARRDECGSPTWPPFGAFARRPSGKSCSKKLDERVRTLLHDFDVELD